MTPTTSLALQGSAQSATPTGAAVPARMPRVEAIDGLRAAAALWVVLFHMRAFSGRQLWPWLDFIARSGSTGVSLFLVLSGLCLYLPFAGGRTARFRGREFFSRRIRRLLPAYYATLALVVVAHVVAAGRLGLPIYSPAQWAGQMATHLTLTHQLFPSTFYGLNGAFWSLGLEWELYLTLPLLLVAAARWGLARTVAGVVGAAAAYSVALVALVRLGVLDGQGVWATLVLPDLFLGRWAEFALGMLVAELYRTGRLRVSARALLAAAIAGVVALAWPDNPMNHILYGVVFAALAAVVLAGDNLVARIFSWRPLVAVGVLSYSLYLVHQPLLEMLGSALGADRGADPHRVFLVMLAAFPIILALALLLFVTVERRSLGPPGAPVRGVRELLWPTPVEVRDER